MRLTLDDPQGRFTLTVDLGALLGLELPALDLGGLIGGLAAPVAPQRQAVRTEGATIDGQQLTLVYVGNAVQPVGAVWAAATAYDKHRANGRPWVASRNDRPNQSYHNTLAEAIEAVAWA